ncbi:MAG TPA: hypothetical protein VGN32_08485 [Ktedonobacterales bacterium]|nr:hypothetical protein [Ktedonobacterales bacterium]
MNSRTDDDFWTRFKALPEEVRRQAREAFRSFKRDPFSPGLTFKEVNKRHRYWSVRITRGYRAVGIRDDGEITWTWIGSHADYDQYIARK